VAVAPLPDAVKPVPHMQVYPPAVSVQTLVAERFCAHVVDVRHSFTAPHVAVSPLPEGRYPLPHEQV